MKNGMRSWARIIWTGSIASVLSSATIVLASRRDAGAAAAGTNGASQWVRGRLARFRKKPSLRYTATGYAIHHASSIWWAAVHESPAAKRLIRHPVARAAVVAGLAALVDYRVVPKRFTPGFEAHLTRASMSAVYATFAAGLWLGTRLHDSFSGISSGSSPRDAGPLSTLPPTGSKREP